MKNIIITGSTGVIGSKLLQIIVKNSDANVYAIIRADSEEHLRKRVLRLIEKLKINKNESEKIIPIRGDITMFQLGIEDRKYRELTQIVTHIIHCAGNVKLNQSLEEARAYAVHSVQNIISLAKVCLKNKQLEKVDIISTVGVGGKMKGNIPEKPLQFERGFHNTYEAAKAEAETIVLSEIKNGLPISIHRPSMVVGDSKNGEVKSFQVFYYICDFLSGKRTMGIIPNIKDFYLDIIPVDYVANAIWISSTHPETIGEIFHLCSGAEKNISLSIIEKEVMRHNKNTLANKIPIFWFELIAKLGKLFPGKLGKTLGSLLYFVEYMKDPQVFENKNTDAFFSTKGLTLPNPENYLKLVLDYYFLTKKR